MEDIRTHLKFGSSCRIDNNIYFFNRTFNGVFYLDLKDFSVHFVHKFDVEWAGTIGLSMNYESIFYKDAIYFFPTKTNVIMKYDIVRHQEQIIEIPDFDDKDFNVTNIIQRQNRVYLFPTTIKKGVFVLDLLEDKVKKDNALSALFKTDLWCGNVLAVSKDSVLLSLFNSNKVYEINLDTAKMIDYSRMFHNNIKIFSIYFDGNNYWILQMESTDIYEWNKENGLLQKYKNESVIWEDKIGVPYSNLIFLDDEILVLNYSLKHILRINKKKKTIENPLLYPKGFRLVNNAFCNQNICDYYIVLEDKVLIYPCRGNMLLIYDKETKQLSGSELIVSEKEVPYLWQIVEESFIRNESAVENDDFVTLDVFLDMMKRKEESVIQEKDKKNIGQLICQKCLKD